MCPAPLFKETLQSSFAVRQMPLQDRPQGGSRWVRGWPAWLPRSTRSRAARPFGRPSLPALCPLPSSRGSSLRGALHHHCRLPLVRRLLLSGPQCLSSAAEFREPRRRVRCGSGRGAARLLISSEKVSPPGLFLAVKHGRVSQHSSRSARVHHSSGLTYQQPRVHQLFPPCKEPFPDGSSAPPRPPPGLAGSCLHRRLPPSLPAGMCWLTTATPRAGSAWELTTALVSTASALGNLPCRSPQRSRRGGRAPGKLRQLLNRSGVEQRPRARWLQRGAHLPRAGTAMLGFPQQEMARAPRGLPRAAWRGGSWPFGHTGMALGREEAASLETGMSQRTRCFGSSRLPAQLSPKKQIRSSWTRLGTFARGEAPSSAPFFWGGGWEMRIRRGVFLQRLEVQLCFLPPTPISLPFQHPLQDLLLGSHQDSMLAQLSGQLGLRPLSLPSPVNPHPAPHATPGRRNRMPRKAPCTHGGHHSASFPAAVWVLPFCGRRGSPISPFPAWLCRVCWLAQAESRLAASH